MFGWFTDRRRRKLRAAPLPEAWRDFLESHVKQYRLLSDGERRRLDDNVKVLVAEKKWIGCNGLEMTDEIRVAIAGYVGLMLLGAQGAHHYFDEVLSVLVYPAAFATSHGTETFGEAWQRGPVILSWANILDNKGTDQNVVIHEFAHQLDGLDGMMEGYPPLSAKALEQWEQIADREYRRLVKAAEHGRATLLDHYGAQNPAEFFAVLSECFFEQPIALAETHPKLFQLVADFYMQDPRRWYESAPARPVAWHGMLDEDEEFEELDVVAKHEWDDESGYGDPHADAEAGALTDDMSETDRDFARGVILLGEEDWAAALRAFDRVIEAHPDDAEAWWHKGEAIEALEGPAAALPLMEKARSLDPSNDEILRALAITLVECGRWKEARRAWKAVLATPLVDSDAHVYAARIYIALGHPRSAMYALGRAIVADPENAEAYRRRSDLYRQRGDTARADADAAEAERLDPDL